MTISNKSSITGPILFQNRKMGFFNVFFLGINLKNYFIILILYLKSKDSATHIIMFLLKHW